MISPASCMIFIETQKKQLLKLLSMLPESIAVLHPHFVFAFYPRALKQSFREDLNGS